jgi:transcriptional regulator with XRE-family HTH domain
MEMKVDTQLIKSERKKRAWSQEHLARVSGLGHRTIQRIENTVLAAYDSVMAIASALDLDTAALRLEENGTVAPTGPSESRLSKRLELPARLLLAVVSAVLVPLILAAHFYQQWEDAPDYFGKEFLLALAYPFCGALFGLTVLCPYLKRDKKLLLNAVILTAAGALSFYCATWVAVLLGDVDSLFGFVAASTLGAAIVLIASKMAIPLKSGFGTWLRLMLAAAVSGAVVYAAVVYRSDYQFDNLAAVLGFCSWHCVLSVMLYYGRTIDESGNRPGSILQDFLVRVAGKPTPDVHSYSSTGSWRKYSHVWTIRFFGTPQRYPPMAPLF